MILTFDIKCIIYVYCICIVIFVCLESALNSYWHISYIWIDVIRINCILFYSFQLAQDPQINAIQKLPLAGMATALYFISTIRIDIGRINKRKSMGHKTMRLLSMHTISNIKIKMLNDRTNISVSDSWMENFHSWIETIRNQNDVSLLYVASFSWSFFVLFWL